MTELLSFYTLLFKNIIEYLMEVIKMVSPSDWIFIICTLILAIIALFGPYINEIWKRKSLAPNLKINFYKESAFIVSSLQEDSFSIFFEVKNNGNSEAKNCTAIIEEFWFENEDGNFIKNEKYFPAKLLASDSPIINILPKASNFFKLFLIFKTDQDKINLRIDIERLIERNQGANILKLPFTYLKIKIVIYSENAKKCVQQIKINSPGIWRKDIKQVLQEVQITLS